MNMKSSSLLNATNFYGARAHINIDREQDSPKVELMRQAGCAQGGLVSVLNIVLYIVLET